MRKVLLMVMLMMNVNGLYAKPALEALQDMIEAREQGGLVASKESINTSVVNNHQAAPFFKSHKIVFFFASTCPFCYRLSPILKQWADLHGAEVEARSFDDRPLAEFQAPLPATKELVEVAYFGQTIRYPAIFIMNNDTHVLVPASFGLMNESELDARITGLMTKIEAIERRVGR